MGLLRLLFPQTSKIPRWVIFFIDIVICAFSFVVATLLRFNFFIDQEVDLSYLRAIPVVLCIRIVFIFYFRIYAGIIRHTSLQDAIRVFYTVTFSTLAIGLVNVIYTKIHHDQNVLIPISIIIIDYLGTILLMNAFRFTTKVLYMYVTKPDESTIIPYAIFGAGEAGLITKRKLEQHRGGEIKVVAFFDDNPRKSKSYIDGVTIYNGTRDFESVIHKLGIRELIISIQNISKNRKQEIIENCLQLNVKVRNVPPVERWINGELSYNQIKDVKIEDLIERDTIVLNKEGIASQIKGKVVMVSGAAGSIGSEISKQLIGFNPQKLILVDKSEVRLYELDAELREHFPVAYSHHIELIMADIGDEARMTKIFNQYHPSIIYHAAAYKHVPLMEDNPGEAVKVNVGGTKTLADLAVAYQVDKFVMVSTDKAVNPTNVMGASKRIAEIYVQSLNNKLQNQSSGSKNKHTKFITTRFGNVLGSSGSVIPRFRKQIEDGGPITVTHPEITRYFMTIPEACQLVLEAGNMGKGGEIYIFDMGKSTKIIDLAKKMVQLSGLTLGQDIQIVFTGLRPGEKIKEELLADTENTLPTHHPKIMIAQVRTFDFRIVDHKIESLIQIRQTQDDFEIVKKMKEIVPEFISQNSRFEELDVIPMFNSLQAIQTESSEIFN